VKSTNYKVPQHIIFSILLDFHVTDQLTDQISNYMESLLDKLRNGCWSRNSVPFMEPEDSLPCSQEPANGPYPDHMNQSILSYPTEGTF